MTTGDALLAAIWERPHDDLPRLAYADWLDDQGAPEQVARAEFIRVQCELARLDGWDDGREPLEIRVRELWAEHGLGWPTGLRWPNGNVRHARRDEYRRGFLHPRPLEGQADVLARRSPADLIAAAPLWDVRLYAHGHPTAIDHILGRAERLAASGGTRAVALAGPRPHLRHLTLHNGDATAAGLADVIQAGLAGQLRRLGLGFFSHGPEQAGVVGALGGPAFVGLEHLEVTAVTCSLGPFLATPLRHCPNHLTISIDTVSDAELLAGWELLRGVRWLELSAHSPGWPAMLRSPLLADLRWLRLKGREYGRSASRRALETLLDPAVLRNLRHLEVVDGWDTLGERRAAVQERFGNRLVLR